MRRLLVITMLVLLIAAGGARGATSVLALDMSSFDLQVLGSVAGISHTEVSPAGLLTADLSGYQVLYVGSTFQGGSVTIPSQSALNALNARASDTASFIQSGHGVLALSELIGTGRYSWLPVPLASYYGYNWGYDAVIVADATPPVMDGITSPDLSGWGPSGHAYFTSWSTLDILATWPGGQPVTLAGTYGGGRMVITGQDADFHFVYGPSGKVLQFVQNAFDWLATGESTIPAPGAAVLASIGTGLVGWFRRRGGSERVLNEGCLRDRDVHREQAKGSQCVSLRRTRVLSAPAGAWWLTLAALPDWQRARGLPRLSGEAATEPSASGD
jgi:hypothetical protein